MSKFDEIDFGTIHSQDDLDLLSLGFGLPEEPAPQQDEEPRLNPLHDMDSWEFQQWLEDEVDKEHARRQAQKAAAGAAPDRKPTPKPDQKPE